MMNTPLAPHMFLRTFMPGFHARTGARELAEIIGYDKKFTALKVARQP